MSSKSIIATGLATAIAATGGWVVYESMKSDGQKNDQAVNADFRPNGDEQETNEPVDPAKVVGKSEFLKRPELDMDRAVTTGTLTSAEKIKRDRERAKRARQYLEIGFTGNWRGLSPFAVNESIIAKAQIAVAGSDAAGLLWIVTEFTPEGAHCTIVELEDARVVGNHLSFRADGKAGELTLSANAEVANGTWSGRKAQLVRIPPKELTN